MPEEPKATADPTRQPKGLIDFVRHLHPRSVAARSLTLTATFGLGMIALGLCGALVVTGVLLMVYYIPDAGHAYGSIQDIESVVPFGGLSRNVHRWAGHALVAVVGLHLLRALLCGAYKGPRRRGIWTAGVWLLVLTLAFAFTGYLLPWDQLSYWAVTIGGHLAGNVPLLGSSLRQGVLGGEEVTSTTLIRFYALHVGILPALTTVFVILHLYRLRRAGGLARPDEGEPTEKLSAWPHLYERELALLLLVVAALVVAALLVDAPLLAEPDPAHPEDPSKAPWYFLSLQELVSHSALLGGVVLPLLALVGLYLVPFLDRSREGRGQWLAPRPAGRLFALGALLGLGLVPGALALAEGPPDGAINPATALLAGALLLGGGVLLWARRAERRDEAAQLALFALGGLATTALVLLTLVGWLRGPSWSLALFGGGG